MVGLVLASPWWMGALASGEAMAEGGLVVRIVDPAPVAFDLTAFGRTTHRVRVVYTNETRTPIAPTARRFHVIATRDGLVYPCDEPMGDERWPHRLDPNESHTIDLNIRCDTPLPGRYDLDIRSRPRSAADTEGQSIGTSAIVIEPGPTPPVRVPGDARLWVASMTTKEVQPAKNASVRVVVAFVNGSKREVSLAPAQALVKITRRGEKVTPCAPKLIDLAFSGTLGPGRVRSLASSVPCDLSNEGSYDVDITLTAPARAHLGTHAVRAIAVPLPHPGPTGTLPADLTP